MWILSDADYIIVLGATEFGCRQPTKNKPNFIKNDISWYIYSQAYI